MVQFPQSRFRTLFIQMRMTASPPPGYPIRPSTDHRMFAPPRRFSQLTTAFLASIRQGIHRKPFSRLTILSFLLKILRISSTFSIPHLKAPASCQRSIMEIRGFEPLTSSLQSWRSSQLSYIPALSVSFDISSTKIKNVVLKKRERERAPRIRAEFGLTAVGKTRQGFASSNLAPASAGGFERQFP